MAQVHIPKVYNKYHGDAPSDAVNIMRPNKWGNPFKVGKNYGGKILNREEAVHYHRDWLLRTSNGHKLLRDIEELKGKDLLCCCSPKLCHGDTLLEFANQYEWEWDVEWESIPIAANGHVTEKGSIQVVITCIACGAFTIKGDPDTIEHNAGCKGLQGVIDGLNIQDVDDCTDEDLADDNDGQPTDQDILDRQEDYEFMNNQD